MYAGRARLADEVAAERITLEGTPRKRRDFYRWMAWSSFAGAARRDVAGGGR